MTQAGRAEALDFRAAAGDAPIAAGQRGAGPVPSADPVALRIVGASKRFPGVRALDNVDFDLRAGEVHVLFGENGAGKSTLISIIAGALKPDSGTIDLRGERIELHSVDDARKRGIAAVFQDFSLAPDLTVEENIFLGIEPMRGIVLDKRAIRERARQALKEFGFALDPRTVVSALSRAEQQMLEITKALVTHPRILILDEPTASLTERETAALFRLVATLKAEGAAIIYITHRIAELEKVGDRVTVLRDGQKIATLPIAEVSHKALVELMTGRPIGNFIPRIRHEPAETLLSVSNLTTRNKRVLGASIAVRGGEVVGLAGLVGCGKSEIGRACFGVDTIESGSIEFLGAPVADPSPATMLRRGLSYIPSDRHREGLMLNRSMRENMSLAVLDTPELARGGVLRRRAERSLARRLCEKLRVRPPHIESDVTKFSGGNQQKVLLAKSVARKTRLFIFDEPTTGIDVGAKVEFYEFLQELVAAGNGVLLISSELPEILNLCNRVYVVANGSIRAELEGDTIDEQRILANFFHNG
ncbi:MAG: sugar ABC transporter ATP-binding protein [Dongiaceae bacterium]